MISSFHPATNLLEILHRQAHSCDAGITFLEGSVREEVLSYKDLYYHANNMLAYLQSAGMRAGQELVLQVENNRNFVVAFWACVLGGIIPVPLSPGTNDEHRRKILHVWKTLRSPRFLSAQNNLQELLSVAHTDDLVHVVKDIQSNRIDLSEALSFVGKSILHPVGEDDVAFLQFSSGSTGTPKGVVLTHKNLLANMYAIGRAAAYTSDDSTISWMPLTHDMGLIGFHLNPMLYGMNQYIIPTNLFIRNPAVWMDKATKYRTTILCSPNFGYRYLLRHATAMKRDWDLSAVRIVYNGAEPISEAICNEFLDCLEQYNLSRKAMCPVYGLAEASLAVSISSIDSEIVSLHLDRKSVVIGNEINISDEADAVSFLNVGTPVDCGIVCIVDNNGELLSDRVVGHIQIKGDHVSSGYYRPEGVTFSAGPDGWVPTGDLGFFDKGSLYVTGRAKDIFFVNGQNFYPHDVERVAEEIDGIELNKIAVAGYFNNETGSDTAIAFVFYRGNLEQFALIAKELRARINLKFGFELSSIIPVKDIPRTTSGKLQRFKLLERYQNGEYAKVERSILELIKTDEHSSQTLNDVQYRILKIWNDILGVNNTAIDVNFFEIGGNSLRAATVEMMLGNEFKIRLPDGVVYEEPSVRRLANRILTGNTESYDSIPRCGIERYPLSVAQRRIYFSWAMDRTSTAYNIPVAFRINGSLDVARLNDAIVKLVVRHDALRTKFLSEEEAMVLSAEDVTIELKRISCNSSELQNKLRSLVCPFDLMTGPLFKIALIEVSDGSLLLFADFHHSVMDGISVYNFLKDLLCSYNVQDLPYLPVGFADYAHWQQLPAEVDKTAKQKEYWLSIMRNEPPLLELPVDFLRPVVFDSRGEKIEFSASSELYQKLKKIAVASETTLHVLLLAVYKIFLSKYTRQNDLIVGIPVSGRVHPEIQGTLGMFVNNLPIRCSIKSDDIFFKFVNDCKQVINAAFDNQEYPFGKLVTDLDRLSDSSRNPVFDLMFVYQNMGIPQAHDSEITFSRHFFDPGFSKFDLSLEVFETGKSLDFAFEYATALFKPETVHRMRIHFENLLKCIASNCEATISQLSILSDEERGHYCDRYNATASEYPTTTIHQLVAETIERVPGNCAIEFNERKISYRELGDRVNALAASLQERGVEANAVVGLFFHRSPELVVSILAVLKAGGCYLPIDPELPVERTAFMIENARCKLLLTETTLVQSLKQCIKRDQVNILCVDSQNSIPEIKVSIQRLSGPTDVAYIIYTSGTSGRPKGVMIEHKSLVNYVTWAAKQYFNDSNGVVPFFTSISFDLTITAIFTPLVTGGTIVIYKEDEHIAVLDAIISENKVDIVKLTPSHLKLFAARMELVKRNDTSKIVRFVVGGEQLETSAAKRIHTIFNGNAEICNEYGPTEATVGCMIHRFDVSDENTVVPIGVPADNTQVYLLDQFLNPVPLGVAGDIYVSGDGIARGYLFNETLTQDRFIHNPFVEGTRMYKTGDVAKRLATGVIEYIGRNDQQVKINGHRIELTEIEFHLRNYPAIREAVVTIKENKKKQHGLIAYFKSEEQIHSLALTQHLSLRIPYYMIPSSFIRLDEIPLTENGKIDYRALPDHEVLSDDVAAQTTKTQELLLSVWRSVLGEENINIRDNFFDLGGDSIKAVQITSRLREYHGIALRVKDLLTYHTIEQISMHSIFAGHENRYEQGHVQGTVTLTPIAKWFVDHRFADPGFYNQSVLLNMKGLIDKRIVQQAFKKLIEHHDGLRLNYDAEKGVLFFNPHHLQCNDIVEEILADGYTTDEESRAFYEFKNGFDLKNDLLLKAMLIRKYGEYRLLITAHHLIIDGVSWRILLDDLRTIYNDILEGRTTRLASKTASLKEWSRFIGQYAESVELNNQKNYWNTVNNLTFSIPVDSDTADWRLKNLLTIRVELDRERTDILLRYTHRIFQSEAVVLLNTALALVLKEWTGSDHLVIEYESHGRVLDGIDVSRTVGWFTALYPLSLEVRTTIKEELILSIQEQMRNVPASGIGYEIVRSIQKGDRGLNERLSEVRFNYLGQFDAEINNDLFSYCADYSGDSSINNTMTAKLEINAMVINGKLQFEIRYNKQAHLPSTIVSLGDRLLYHLENILNDASNAYEIHNPSQVFADVDLNEEDIKELFG